MAAFRRTTWLVVVLTLAAGCLPARRSARELAGTPGEPAGAAPTGEVREGSLHGGFITIRVLLPPAGPRPAPAVLTLIGQEDALLALGLAVVSFETHWELLQPLVAASRPAGEAATPSPAQRSWGKWLLASPSPRTVGEGYFRLIKGTAQGTIPQVLDWLGHLPEVDAGHVGIVGTSTNGFTALQATGGDRRIVAAVVLAACGDYRSFVARSPLGLGGEMPFDPTPDYAAFLAAHEPIRHPKRLLHAAVLMVHGDADHAVPISCARDTARVLAAAYRRAGVPERFRYVEVPGGTHDLGGEGRWQAFAWLYRWLRGPEGRTLGGRER